jgi:hypothetical protein
MLAVFCFVSHENQSRQHTNLLGAFFHVHFYFVPIWAELFCWVHFEEEEIHFLSETTFVQKIHFSSSDHHFEV